MDFRKVAFLLFSAFVATGCDDSSNNAPSETSAAVVPATPSATVASVPIDVATVRAQDDWKAGGAKADLVDGALRLVSFPTPGGFSARLDLPESARKAGPGRLKIDIEVDKGAFEIWPSPLGEGAARLSPGIAVTSGSSVVEMPLADLATPMTIMFANGSPSGPSEATIRSIEIVQP